MITQWAGVTRLARLQLWIEFGGIAADRREQETVHTTEIAGNALLRLDRFDAVNRGRLTLVIELRQIKTPELDEGIKGIIGNCDQVRGRAGGHALADRAAIEDHHVLAAPHQLIRG